MFVKGLCMGITGTRTTLPWDQLMMLKYVLDVVSPEYIRHGDCTGADLMAHTEALSRGIKCIIHPPEEDRYRAYAQGAWLMNEPKPYLQRNKDIVSRSDLLVALPMTMEEERRSGTWSTVRVARHKEMPIYIVYPNGELKKEG